MPKIALNLPWRPDHPPLGNPGLLVARNCLPGAGHYRPLPIPTPVSGANQYSGQAEGLWVAARPNGLLVQFAAFGGHIYRLPSLASPPVLVDGAGYPYGYELAEGERWRTVQYGPLSIATNGNDPIQSVDVTDLSGEFDDLDSSAPKARYIAVIRDFVVVASTEDEVDGLVGNRVRWHGIDAVTGLPDPTEWDISLSTRADFQDIPDLGNITGLTGGAFGTLLLERGIARLDFGGQYVFSVSVPVTQVGCSAPGSVVQFAQMTYFLGDYGILYRFDGQNAVPLNRYKNDAYLRADIDLSKLHTMWAAPDPGRRLIFWSYDASDNTRRLICYSVDDEEFTFSGVNATALGPVFSTESVSDEISDFDDLDAMDIDLDATDVDLDDQQLWASGQMLFAIVDSQLLGEILVGTIRAFIGGPLSGVFGTAEVELAEGRRAIMNRALIHYEVDAGGRALMRIGTRERQTDDVVWSDYMTGPQSDGFWRFRAAGRYHRIEIKLDEWKRIQAVEFWGAPLGVR